MNKIETTNKYLIGIVLLFVLRGLLNAYVPLMDKTEARYAEIARIMQETNNWITPQIDYGIPFWAKPPLSTWLSALSMKIFGVNEFAVRLPYLLISAIIIIIISKFAKEKKFSFLIGFILLTIPEFFLHAGVVSTDLLLSFCIAMIFLTFWKAFESDRLTFWGYLIFVFIGLGLLAKGPIVLILTIPPILIWIIYYKQYTKFFFTIPFFTGTILSLVIAIPWYYLTEIKTKGFLDYFIIGEHYNRFFNSNWDGDKYGFAKNQPFGIIWIFLFAFAFPWIYFLLIQIWKDKKNILQNNWIFFLLLWLVWTPFIFTFSSSLIHPYILPSMVPIALLLECYWKTIQNKKTAIWLSLIFPTLIILITTFSLLGNNKEFYSKTDKYLLSSTEYFPNEIYYLGNKSYSSQFYSEGKIRNISIENLKVKLHSKDEFHILIENQDLYQIDSSILKKINLLNCNNFSGIYEKKEKINKQKSSLINEMFYD